MKKFEVPYNFHDDYFEEIMSLDSIYFKYIKFIYIPAFNEDYIQNTREEELINNKNYNIYNNYVNIIKKFQSLNLDVCILIQRNASLKLIEKYINEFNIKYFVINDDKLAKTLKKKYKDKIHLILSITRKLNFNDIINNNYSMYDEIVLDFWFNRHLNLIKQLPTKYKYTILVNSECNYKCHLSKKHWFTAKIRGKFPGCPANFNDSIKIYAPDLKYFNNYNFNDSIKIYAPDLKYFNNYITSFKLIDRSYDSKDIKDIIKLYIDYYIKMDTIEYDINKENHYNL